MEHFAMQECIRDSESTILWSGPSKRAKYLAIFSSFAQVLVLGWLL